MYASFPGTILSSINDIQCQLETLQPSRTPDTRLCGGTDDLVRLQLQGVHDTLDGGLVALPLRPRQARLQQRYRRLVPCGLHLLGARAQGREVRLRVRHWVTHWVINRGKGTAGLGGVCR